MNQAILELEHLCVRFHSKRILDRITLEVMPHEVIAIMGPGGAGKSTLLRTICGFNDSVSAMVVDGTYRYLGESASETEERPELIQQRIDLTMMPVREVLLSNLPERANLDQQQQTDVIHRVLEANQVEHLAAQLSASFLDLTLVDRQLLMLVRATMSSPHLICLDEPTSGMDDATAARLLELIRIQGQKRTVVFVTHNQRHAREVADRCVLLASGRIIEEAPRDVFFGDPAHAITQMYIKRGSCSVPSLNTPLEYLDDEGQALVRELDAMLAARRLSSSDEAPAPTAPRLPPPPTAAKAREGDATGNALDEAMRTVEEMPTAPAAPAPAPAPAPTPQLPPTHRQPPTPERPPGAAILRKPARPARTDDARIIIPEFRGPHGFRWMVPGIFGGSPQPGMFTPMSHDLEALQRVRTTVLVTLTEYKINTEEFADFGITSIYFPIIDMDAPSLEDCAEICAQAHALVDAGETVVFHCKAGLGRTGTMLAACLIWEGVSAEAAITQARRTEPRWIQSTRQEAFLAEFERYVAAQRGLESTNPSP